ncbi:MAG: cytochrome oxidase subunit III [Deltaproteobacteria bacterium]|nr:MAG: cytochrome oxidase subunit III [Deltaproteobacteria bacterium]
MHRPIATTRAAAGLPTGRLAIWWVLVTEIFIFGGLLAAYIMHRLAHDAWAGHAEHTNIYAGSFNTLVLLTSSLSAVLAHKAAEEGNGPKAAKLLGLTMLGGVIFVTVKAFEWAGEIQLGYTILTNTFWSFYYTAAGLHACHVIAGVVIMGFVAAAARKGEELQRVELIGIYWHFVDLIWIFLFPLLYIAR